MASESTARSSEPATGQATKPQTPSEPPLRSERRMPSARETLGTLPEGSDDFDFEPHDTIPAPPWLDELEDKISPPHKAP